MWYVIGAVAGFLAVVLSRALFFRPLPSPRDDLPVSDFDADAAVTALAELV